MAMRKSHRVVVSLTFDKPCTKAEATAAFRDCVHGEFYPYIPRDDGPGEFRIRGVRTAPAKENDNGQT